MATFPDEGNPAVIEELFPARIRIVENWTDELMSKLADHR